MVDIMWSSQAGCSIIIPMFAGCLHHLACRWQIPAIGMLGVNRLAITTIVIGLAIIISNIWWYSLQQMFVQALLCRLSIFEICWVEDFFAKTELEMTAVMSANTHNETDNVSCFPIGLWF